MSTAALRSKRIEDPPGLRISCAVRTMTALRTSPFFTRPRGIASLTLTTMTSPTVAYLRFEPPSTLMHMTRRAPELSATSRLVCIWIMRRLASFRLAQRARSLRLLLAAHHHPALEPGQRAVLLDPHDVSDRLRVGLVVGVVLLGLAHRLLEHGMGEAALDAHHHRLVRRVADHGTLQHALRHQQLLDFDCAGARLWRGRALVRGKGGGTAPAPARGSRRPARPAGGG